MSKCLLQLAAGFAFAFALTASASLAQITLENYGTGLEDETLRVIEEFSAGDGAEHLSQFIEIARETVAARNARRSQALLNQIPPKFEDEEITFEPFVVGDGAKHTTRFRDVVMLMKMDQPVVPVDPDPDATKPERDWARQYGAFTDFAPEEGFCTGVFVSDGTILTAAHCVCSLGLFNEAGRSTTMALWGFDFGTSWVRHGPMTASPLDSTAEPVLYDSLFCERLSATRQVQTADVALIHLDPVMGERRRLEGEINARLSEFAWPNLFLSREHKVMTVVGYGFNELGGDGFAVKVSADVPVVDSHCHLSDVISLVRCRIGQEIVLIDTVFGNDTCNGDSGGPAYIKYYNRYYLAGITSRGAIPGNGCGSGGIYTLLTPKLQNWIRRNVRDYGSAL